MASSNVERSSARKITQTGIMSYLKCDDNETDEDVHHEEGDDDNEADKEQRDGLSVVVYRTHAWLRTVDSDVK